MARVVQPRVVVVGATLQPGERSYDHLRAERGPAVPPLQDPEKLAALLYTSGTSGRPRAAMLTHRALLANIEQVAAVEPPMIHGDDVVLGVLPLFHVYGLNAVLGGVLRHRAKLVLADALRPGGHARPDRGRGVQRACRWRRRCSRTGATSTSSSERLGPVRLVLSGSAPLAPEVIEEFTAATGIPVHQGYGLTEAAPVVTSTLCSEELQTGSVGCRAPRHRDPAGRRGRARRPRARTRARSRSAAPTCSAATGPTAPAARTPRAGGPPATSGSSTPAATCSWSTGSRSW